jgi:hypothetical protein
MLVEPYILAAFYNHYDGSSASNLGFARREAFIDDFKTAALSSVRNYSGNFDLDMESIAQGICDKLLVNGVIETEVDPLAGLYLSLKLDKFPSFRQTELAENPVYQRMQKVGTFLLTDAFANALAQDDWGDDGAMEILAPASDRIVTLDHNNPDIAKIRDSLDEVSEELRKDNSEAIANPDEKNRFIAQLKAASELLKLNRLSVRSLSALILPVLYYLADKFAEGAIGALASELLKLIALQFGISI